MKERLVGAAVLVAIAVWLVPWVLDGPEEGVESAARSLQLPAAEEPVPMRTQKLRLGDPPAQGGEPAPQASAALPPASASPAPDAAAAAEPARGEPGPAAEDRKGAETAVAAARPEAEPAAPPPRAAPSEPKPKAEAPAAAAAGDWTVQLGSFGEEANARRIAQRAGTFGYKAEVSSTRSNGRTLYRVRVGPQATRAAAEAAASALRAHGLKDASVVAAR